MATVHLMKRRHLPAGTPGQTYNVGSGLGIPDISRLAADFAGQDSGHGHHGR